MLDNPTLGEQLTAVMRRLFVADLLSRQWIIAIGGSQGAGKTTLVRLMYDLNQLAVEQQWLPANEGRGECMPVLLLEDDTISAPQGYLRCLRQFCLGSAAAAADVLTPALYHVIEEKASPAEFRSAITGRNKDVLLPVLRLPRRYFSTPDQAFLLLPGYENRQQENSDWQDLMRQALVGAPASIIVTDQTRLANAQQREILKDMQASELSGTQPIVVVSKTESIAGAPEKQQALRATAGDVFEIAPEQRERFIILSGTAPDHVNRWRATLSQALEQVTTASGQSRQRQLDHLTKLLSHDLTMVLADIRMAFTVHVGDGTDANNHELLRDFLETFDMARDRLREEYRRGLNEALTNHVGSAWKRLDQTLIDDHEGLWSKVRSLCDTVGEQRQRVLNDIQAAWNTGGPFALRHVDVLGAVTAKKLGRTNTPPLALLAATDAGQSTARQLACLGYTDTHGQSVTWKEPSETTRHNLAIIFYPKSDDNGCAGNFTKDLKASIKLLPALALEFGRIGSLFPQELGDALLTLAAGTELTAAAQRVQQNFAALGNTSNDIIKGLAIMLAIDGAADGKIDTIPALLLSMLGLGEGGALLASGGAGAALAGAVSGMVTVGLLTCAVLQEVKRQDSQARDAAQSALLSIKERHYAHYLEHFDIMMDHVRDTMQQRLWLRYRLDEALMRRDRLAKALADIVSLKLDLEEQLGLRGHAMALVAPV